jgi:hypothetical protein
VRSVLWSIASSVLLTVLHSATANAEPLLTKPSGSTVQLSCLRRVITMGCPTGEPFAALGRRRPSSSDD